MSLQTTEVLCEIETLAKKLRINLDQCRKAPIPLDKDAVLDALCFGRFDLLGPDDIAWIGYRLKTTRDKFSPDDPQTPVEFEFSEHGYLPVLLGL